LAAAAAAAATAAECWWLAGTVGSALAKACRAFGADTEEVGIDTTGPKDGDDKGLQSGEGPRRMASLKGFSPLGLACGCKRWWGCWRGLEDGDTRKDDDCPLGRMGWRWPLADMERLTLLTGCCKC
jgi:hypothetical protein